MKNEFVVSPNFQANVESHLFGNFLIDKTNSPLVLGIFGPPGEGKTFQLELVCKSLEIEQLVISPGELESENAGHPGQLLRSLYLKAGTTQGTYKPSVLIINDIDTVLGDWGARTQYTVNRQIVYGQLMAFCDYPNQVSGHHTNRVPIIITGNNPKILYEPLLRPGRMRLMSWTPDINTKLEIIEGIFPDATRMDLQNALKQFPNEPISFWSDVKAHFWELNLIDWLQKKGRKALMSDLANGNRYELGQAPITLPQLIEIASILKTQDIRRDNFLEKHIHGK